MSGGTVWLLLMVSAALTVTASAFWWMGYRAGWEARGPGMTSRVLEQLKGLRDDPALSRRK